MTGRDDLPRERRRQGRFKKTVTAICKLQGLHFKAVTYDISESGITLLAHPDLPFEDRFQLECVLPSGTSALFEVEEKQRRVIGKGKKRCLRLGLAIVNESLEIVEFLRELAELFMSETGDSQDLDQTDSMTFDEPPKPVKRPRGGFGGRSHKRIQFQLPARAKIDGKSYRLQTLDMGSWGISVETPGDFPQFDVFTLFLCEPDGREVAIMVQEKNRAKVGEGGEKLRLGLKVIGGAEEFQGFLDKHSRGQTSAKKTESGQN